MENLKNSVEKYTLNYQRLRDVYAKYDDILKEHEQMKEYIEKLISETSQSFIKFMRIDKSNLISDDSTVKSQLLEQLNPLTSDGIVIDRLINGFLDTIQRPCLAVAGLANSGKSTLLNRLLGQMDVLPVEEIVWTGRYTHLFYSDQPILAEFSKDGSSKIECLKESKVPKQYAVLKEMDRLDEDKTKVRISAGLKIDFLETGIDVIDLPPLDENDYFDKINISLFENSMPIMIYVINGNDSFKESDEKYLDQIVEIAPYMKIIYFVTNLDSENEKADNNDPFNSYATSKYDQVVKKLTKVYGRVKEDDVSTTIFGAAIGDECFHETRFRSFESTLYEMIESHIENIITKVGKILSDSLESLLTKILENVNGVQEIKQMQIDELELINKLKKHMEDKQQIIESKLTTKIKDIEAKLSQSYVGDCDYFDKYYRDGIHEYFKTIIEPFCENTDTYLAEQIEISLAKEHVKSNFQTHLFVRLKEIYLNIASVTGKDKVKKLLEKLEKKLASLFLSNSGTDQSKKTKDLEMKRRKIIFKNPEDLAKKLIEGINEHFMERHSEYTEWLKNLEKVASQSFDKGNEDDVMYRLAKLHMYTLDVQFYFTFFEWEKKCNLGQGKQAKVDKCSVRKNSMDEYELAVRTVEFKISNEKDIFMEVYYASFLKEMKNVLHMEGFRIDFEDKSDSSTIIQLHYFYPVMEGNGKKYFDDGIIKTREIKDRLQAVIDIAEAIVDVHDKSIVHRDLLLENILYNEEHEFVVSDFGLCKSTGLDSSIRKSEDINKFWIIFLQFILQKRSQLEDYKNYIGIPNDIKSLVEEGLAQKTKLTIEPILDRLIKWKSDK